MRKIQLSCIFLKLFISFSSHHSIKNLLLVTLCSHGFFKFQFDKSVEVLQKEMWTHVHALFVVGMLVTYPSGGALYFSKMMRSHTICVCNFPPLVLYVQLI